MRAHKSSSRVGGTEEDGDEDEDALARARALEVEEDARAMVEDLLLGPAGRKLGDVNAIFTLDNTGRRTKIWTSTWKDLEFLGQNGRLVAGYLNTSGDWLSVRVIALHKLVSIFLTFTRAPPLRRPS